ncbi:hypothetical protein D3C80_2157030 [compost metagenome]
MITLQSRTLTRVELIGEVHGDALGFAVTQGHRQRRLAGCLALQQLLAEHGQYLLVEQAVDIAGTGVREQAGGDQRVL